MARTEALPSLNYLLVRVIKATPRAVTEEEGITIYKHMKVKEVYYK